MKTRSHHALAFMLSLVAPHTADVNRARAVGIGGLRHCASKGDSQRPFNLFPGVVIDPLDGGDRTFRPLSALWAKAERPTLQQRIRAIAEHNARNGTQAALFRAELHRRRSQRQADVFRAQMAQRRAAKAAAVG